MVDAIRGPEEEQIEALKAWWQQYGTWVTRILIIVMAMVLGVRYYNHHHTVQVKNASLEYDLLISALSAQANTADKKPIEPTQKDSEQKETVKANQADNSIALHANRLIQEFPRTPYATYAAMILAAQSEKTNDFAGAITQLDSAVPKNKTLLPIWQIRKALALKYHGEFDAALAVLAVSEEKNFSSIVNELKGDLYLAKGDKTQAKAAYESAFASDENKRPLLKIKLDALS